MPPKSPQRPESDNPLHDTGGRKPGQFIERDLWDLDDQWEADSPASPADASKNDAPAPGPDAAEPGPPPAEAGLKAPSPSPPAAAASVPEPAAEKTLADENSPASDKAPSTGSGPPAAPDAARRPMRTAEVVSLIGLALLVLGFGAWFLWVFFDQIPIREERLGAPDFPVKGQAITVKDAADYWREPIRSGANRDTVRSDIALIPVIDLSMEGGGDGALRVFFRNAEGLLVGDSVTCSFSSGRFTDTGKPEIQIAATSGFETLAMYAAYQTAESKPWSIEVYEGPSPRAPLESFRLLFKMPISTERR